MEPSPRVSVIIPTLNEEAHLGSLLGQLAAQPGVEVIVSDGGSEDRTLEVCRRYGVKVVRAPQGRGPQMNAGARAAGGEVLFFLHADSAIEPGLVAMVHAAAKGYSWGCCSLVFDEDALFFRIVAAGSGLRARWLHSCYGDQGIYIRREVFARVGGFLEIPLMEDAALSRRLRRESPPHIVSGRITTSSRRFRAGGPWRTLLKMQVIKAAFALGVKPERLAWWYRIGAGSRP